MIPGGYILQPRVIANSDIATAPPYTREIWSYLLREANSSDNRYAGHSIKRGQLFRDYKTIRDSLAWFVGYRKMRYNENQVKKTMKFLRETGRITTAKELGGVLITICNYDYYQNPKNYERTTGETNENTRVNFMKNQGISDNNKNERNNNNGKKDIAERKKDFALSLQHFKDEYKIDVLKEFFDYWTEPNQSGTKMRMELEKTWDTSRRLIRWTKSNYHRAEQRPGQILEPINNEQKIKLISNAGF